MSVATVLGTDGDLVAAARAGSDEAFDELYARHLARVTGVVRRRVPAADVDDVVQEAFVRAHGNLAQLRDGQAFGAWVRAIAARHAIDHRRRAGAELPVLDLGEVTLTGSGAEPDTIVLAAETAASVHRSLGRLGERDRRALWLRDALEMPVSVVADELGLTVGSTRVLLARARQRLRAVHVAAVAWIVGLAAGLRRRAVDDAGRVLVGVSAASVAGVIAVGLLGPVAPEPPADAGPPAAMPPAHHAIVPPSEPAEAAPSAPAAPAPAVPTAAAAPSPSASPDDVRRVPLAGGGGLEDRPADVPEGTAYAVEIEDARGDDLVVVEVMGEDLALSDAIDGLESDDLLP